MHPKQAWLAAALAIAACGDAAGPAQARSNLTTIQIRVSSAGMDLTTEAGADAFLKRLSRAATNACGGYPDSSPHITDAQQRFRACRAKALAGAVEQSQSAMLQRRFAARLNAATPRLAAK